MTTSDASAKPDITPEPTPTPPSVSISVPTNALAGVPSSITVNAFPGTGFVFQHNAWVPVPAVTFDHTVVTIIQPDGDQVLEGVTTYSGGGGTYAETFPVPGGYGVEVSCFAGSNHWDAASNFTVGAAGPPTFTWTTPADNQAVQVDANGATVSVQLTLPPNQVFPLTVRIDHDGQSVSESSSSAGTIQQMITIPQTPPGNRPIKVTCIDARNQSTSQTRTIVVTDGAPPTVSINSPMPVTLTEIPMQVTVTGSTSGSDVNGVALTADNGQSGMVTDTSTAHNWSTWSATFEVSTAGTIGFTVTATDVRGGSGSSMGSIQVN